ncbi:MAG: hypothetical protein ACQJCO_08870 [cyanobacterium endosymbiont of Rhopalodia sterrenbergii]
MLQFIKAVLTVSSNLFYENQLTTQANSYLSISVTRQGKVLPCYQVDSANDTSVSDHYYRTAMMREHTLLVKGNASEAQIILCLSYPNMINLKELILKVDFYRKVK